MSSKATPGPTATGKKKQMASSPWDQICLSPAARWTPAPGGLRLSEDELTPASLTPASFASPAHFTFETPKQTKHKTFFSSTSSKLASPAQHGYLSVDSPSSSKGKGRTFAMAIFLIWGLFSWSTLLDNNRDPISLAPPPEAPSIQAKTTFSKYFPRDWNAEPSLWVVLVASSSKRAKLMKAIGSETEDSHSFTDDTSRAFQEGKQFSNNLSAFLESSFRWNSIPSVKVTSYYSLQEQGLDYVARQMVTPDGSTTMVQVQFIGNELGREGVKKLKNKIVAFTKQNQPSYLDVHFTGQSWNGASQNGKLLLVGCVLLAMLGLAMKHRAGIHHSMLDWALLVALSMAFNLSGSAILLTNLPASYSGPVTVHTIAALSLVLSVYFSKLQVDGYPDATATIARSGVPMTALFAISFGCISTPLGIPFAAALAVVASSLCFHLLLQPVDVPTRRDPNNFKESSRTPTSRSMVALFLITPILLYLLYQARRINDSHIGRIHGKSMEFFGEKLGHGRLTPFRILFDGHRKNVSMTSLNGYDIVQMVIDEMQGIPLVDYNEAGTDEDFAGSGSTHVGEANDEVQHLIRDLVHRMKHLREEQQREFDFHHHRRQQKWLSEGEGDDFSCDYNVNKQTIFSGIALLENHRIPQSLYSAATKCREIDPRCPSEALHLLNAIEDDTTSSDKLATFVTVNLAMDPFSKDGGRWLRLARETIVRLQKDPRILGGVDVSIAGTAAEYHDTMQEISANFPTQLALIIGLTALTLIVSLKSIWMPVESLAFFGTAVAISLGVGVLVYEDRALGWTRIPALSNHGVAKESFDLPTVFILAVAVMLIKAMASQTRVAEKSTEASTKVVVVCTAFFACLATSSPSLVVFATALVVEMVWIQRLVLPPIASVLRGVQKSPFDNRKARQGLYRSEIEKQNQAYLEKFDRFLLSPQAP